jgi:hypothetical protein
MPRHLSAIRIKDRFSSRLERLLYDFFFFTLIDPLVAVPFMYSPLLLSSGQTPSPISDSFSVLLVALQRYWPL